VSETQEFWSKPQWYQVSYSLAAQRVHAALQAIADRPSLFDRLLGEDDADRKRGLELVEDARNGAVALLIAALSTASEPSKIDERLHGFLTTTVEPTTAVLLAGLLTRPEFQAKGTVELTLPDPGSPPIVEPDERSNLLAALENPKTERGALAQALIDFAFSPTRSYRVNYNLACLAAGRTKRDDNGDARKRALDYLRDALDEVPASRRVQLAEWAGLDPALRPLRGSNEFDKLLSRHLLPELPPETPADKEDE
jgi:hypothetical protein